MIIFANEKIIPCIPAGTPIFKISPSTSPCTRSFLGSTRIANWVFINAANRIAELNTFEITVAVATPSTSIPNPNTKNRLSTTFSIPEITSATSGIWVFPQLRKIAASKLYSRITGIPARYIRIYLTAIGYTSSGTSSIFTISGARNSPSTARSTPPSKATIIDVCTAFEILLWSFCPIDLAIITLLPSEIPTKRLTSNPITGALLPTAAIASLPENCPTTARSAALNSCCKTPVTARGSAYLIILSPNEPFIISIRLFMWIPSFSLSAKLIKKQAHPLILSSYPFWPLSITSPAFWLGIPVHHDIILSHLYFLSKKTLKYSSQSDLIFLRACLSRHFNQNPFRKHPPLSTLSRKEPSSLLTIIMH